MKTIEMRPSFTRNAFVPSLPMINPKLPTVLRSTSRFLQRMRRVAHFMVLALSCALLAGCVVPHRAYHRHEHREDRRDWREDRRDDRHDRHDDRRDNRHDRWEDRRDRW